MEEQSQKKTTPVEIKKEFDKDITTELESMKEKVLNEGEKNCKISRGQQPTIVENQQHDQQQQINNNKPENEIAEQLPSCSRNFNNPGYPGFIEAIRQARKKKQSYDVSFEILFSCLPESVIKQHDFNLNGWWKYCLYENKDPLETDLSVVNSYLEKKLDAGASLDDLESISCTVRLIASDKMEKQMNSSRFLYINKTDCFKTPKSSCQNDSITSSLHIGTKKQDGSKISSVQIDNVQKAKLSEVIDELDTESSTTLLKNSKDLLNNNELTNLKNNSVFLKKAIDSSHLITPLMKPTSTIPPAILLCPASKKKVNKNNEIKKLTKVLENNKENQQITIENTSSQVPSISNVVVDDESDSKSVPDISEIPAYKQKDIDNPKTAIVQDQVEGNVVKMLVVMPDDEQRMITFDIPDEKCTVHDLLEQASIPYNGTTTVSLVKDPILKINYIVEREADTIVDLTQTSDNDDDEVSVNNDTKTKLINSVEKKQQQQQKPLANNNEAIDPPTKTMTSEMKPSTPAKLPVHHNTSPSTPCEINSSESDHSSKGVKQNIVEKSADLQTELQLSNAAPIIQQQQVESEADAIVDLTQTSDNDDDDDSSVNNDEKNIRKSLKLQSALKCRTVKIGSYKYTPKEHVIINTTGLILSVPLLMDETETVKVHVQYQNIYKVLIHSNSSKSTLFFYTNTISGSKIRKLLGMNNPKGPFYDPAGKDQAHKRIILFPISLKSNSIMILKKLFSSNTFVKELNAKEADAILSKSGSLKKTNNSSSKVDKRQTTIVNTNNIVENSTNHPAAPTKGKDTNKSITKAKSDTHSNKDTNSNDKNNEKSNNGNDKLANSDSRKKTSSVINKKRKLGR